MVNTSPDIRIPNRVIVFRNDDAFDKFQSLVLSRMLEWAPHDLIRSTSIWNPFLVLQEYSNFYPRADVSNK